METQNMVLKRMVLATMLIAFVVTNVQAIDSNTNNAEVAVSQEQIAARKKYERAVCIHGLKMATASLVSVASTAYFVYCLTDKNLGLSSVPKLILTAQVAVASTFVNIMLAITQIIE